MDLLATEGWLCGSRRHIGGAGDILAVRCPWPSVASEIKQVQLIEVKSTTRSPWVTFGPKDRQDLVDTALTYGAEPVLAWWPPRGKLRWIRPSEFPPNPQPEIEGL
jgi:Holliday junction resolvase